MKSMSLQNSFLASCPPPLTDELTQLYNREGFICAGAELLEMPARPDPWAFLLYLKVDHLKFINHSLGRDAGDTLLIRTAILLRQVFRRAAVIGRLAEDEFAVLGRVAGPSTRAAVFACLNEQIDTGNLSDHELSLCIRGGFSQFDPRHPMPLTERLIQADAAMTAKNSGH
jgi:diguanylate cyclase (GGDEF)-like protein